MVNKKRRRCRVGVLQHQVSRPRTDFVDSIKNDTSLLFVNKALQRAVELGIEK